MRTAKSIVRAVCGVLLRDKERDQDLMEMCSGK